MREHFSPSRGGQRSTDLRARQLEHYLIMEDAEVAEGAYEVEVAHGPRSGEVLAEVRAAGALVGEA